MATVYRETAVAPVQVVGVPTAWVSPGQQGVAQGCPYRVNPRSATAGQLAGFDKLSESRQNNKLKEVRAGADLIDHYERLPSRRPYRDVIWIPAIFLTFVAATAVCFYYVNSDILQSFDQVRCTRSFSHGCDNEAESAETYCWAEDTLPVTADDCFADSGCDVLATDDRAGVCYSSQCHQPAGCTLDEEISYPSVGEIAACGMAGGIASLGMALVYVWMMYKWPTCIVYTSLLLGPGMCIIMGVVLISVGITFFGFIMLMLGFLMWGCVFFCYRRLIPFMIKLTQVVADIIAANPSMVGVSLVGSFAGIAWTIIVGFAAVGLYAEFGDSIRDQHSSIQYVLYFILCLVLTWGSLAAYNTCHVTYAGVFARWYFKKQYDSVPVRASFMVAMTTSFGSICCGSFLVAFVKALEMLLRKMASDQGESGNTCACVMLMCLQCIVGCIGDILEYFSEWAYVQVAVRGCSFMHAVKITYSLCTCANMTYILKDLLLDYVVTLGTLMCAVSGALIGAMLGYSFGTTSEAQVLKCTWGFLAGLVAGCIAGGSAVGITSSGVKTILVLWAEDPDGLAVANPQIHQEFDQRMRVAFGGW